MDLLRQFDEICKTDIAMAGFTSGLCGEWTEERFQCLAKQLHIDCSRMVYANQQHTDKVNVIEMIDGGYGIIKPHDDNYADAMITAQPGLMLCIHTADSLCYAAETNISL